MPGSLAKRKIYATARVRPAIPVFFCPMFSRPVFSSYLLAFAWLFSACILLDDALSNLLRSTETVRRSS
jgi:hypothetical protein